MMYIRLLEETEFEFLQENPGRRFTDPLFRDWEGRCSRKPHSRLGLSGERGRNRTYNLLIKSQLLCQLSYAPTVGVLVAGQFVIVTSPSCPVIVVEERRRRSR